MNRFLLALGFLLFACLGLLSCADDAPDLRSKERDARLIGAWQMLGYEEENHSPKDKVLVFNSDSSCTGFSHPGGKRLFYTEGNRQLYIFVYGSGLKVSDWTYQKYYEIKEDRLYIWGIEHEMRERNYATATIYQKRT